jgi:hypothetical protein
LLCLLGLVGRDDNCRSLAYLPLVLVALVLWCFMTSPDSLV